MRRFSLALFSATLALSTVLVAVPAMAETSSVSWNFPGGLDLIPGTETEIATLNLPDPEGSECMATLTAANQRSVHPGNNLDVHLNDGLLVTLPGFEDEPFQTNEATAGFLASGSDRLVVYIESTGARITSAAGSLTVTCEPPPPPGGGEGCTPGYWKQPHHFDSWAATGYEPGDSFDVVFGVDSSFDALLDGLGAKGGGERALARHAVAALLNASSPDVSYEFMAIEVIVLVQYAYDTGHFEVVKDLLNDQNETGCPLN
jgi:hypothetical protein